MLFNFQFRYIWPLTSWVLQNWTSVSENLWKPNQRSYRGSTDKIDHNKYFLPLRLDYQASSKNTKWIVDTTTTYANFLKKSDSMFQPLEKYFDFCIHKFLLSEIFPTVSELLSKCRSSKTVGVVYESFSIWLNSSSAFLPLSDYTSTARSGISTIPGNLSLVQGHPKGNIQIWNQWSLRLIFPAHFGVL